MKKKNKLSELETFEDTDITESKEEILRMYFLTQRKVILGENKNKLSELVSFQDNDVTES